MSHHSPMGTFLLACILVITACSPSGKPTSQPPPTQAGPTSTPTLVLATPYAQEPASGICTSFGGGVVTITLNQDIPDPRCAKIRPDQTLSVANNTQNTLRVTIGDFARSLQPGETWSILVPLGDYLAVGVHQLSVYPCCGAELWLETAK